MMEDCCLLPQAQRPLWRLGAHLGATFFTQLARGSGAITSFVFGTSDLRRGARCHLPQGYGGDSELPQTGTALGRIMCREVPKGANGANGANLPQDCFRRL